MKERSAYWDNAKAFLIFFVVLGHFLLPIHLNNGRSPEVVYYFIYLFHMPAFVFISGFFSHNSRYRPAPDRGKLFGFLALYILFMVLDWSVSSLIHQKIMNLNLLSTSGAPWYLLCMFFWYLYLPLFWKTDARISISISILLGLFIGTVKEAGDFLCISRAIVFFPFFLAGYYYAEKNNRNKNRIRRNTAIFVLICCIAILFYRYSAIRPWFFIVYGNSSYSAKQISNLNGILLRLLWYAVSFVLTFSLLELVPSEKKIFTYLGSRTLGIYILHRIIRDVMRDYGIYSYFGTGKTLLLFCIGISIATTMFFSWHGFSDVINGLLRYIKKKCDTE